ncbi:MAG: rhomboid family intramembrane serine protease [Planctomycetaceae bacterium]|nr:rhomboid family intramembrane serine protease [Planctomycetaceae bacterium]
MRKELNGILIFIGILWVIFGIDFILPWDLNSELGLIPRTTRGLWGILTMPFLHGSVKHLLSNTVPLVVLLMLLFSSRPHPVRVIICLVILSGAMLWLVGRSHAHVGASGLIYALMAFLITAGLLERKIVPMAISILVGVLYGGTLIWGVLPRTDSNISWEGHLLGAVAGGVFAWGTVKRKPRKKKLTGSATTIIDQGVPAAVEASTIGGTPDVVPEPDASPDSVRDIPST